MSLYGMMRTGVSGMNAQANRLSTVADNIANSSTTGYKRSSTEFSSLVLPSTAGSYNSGGVTTVVRTAISQAGETRYTTSVTDLAIRGDGFFAVEDASGSRFITRGGSFVPDATGNLVNAAGFKLLGAPEGSTTPPNQLDQLVPVRLAQQGLKAAASENGVISANLPFNTDAIAAPATPASSNNATATYTSKTSLIAYDNIGNKVLLDVYFTKTANDSWEVAVFDNAGANPATGGFPYTATAPATAPLSTETLTFDAFGKMSGAQEIAVSIPNGQTLTVDLSTLTHLGADFSVFDAGADGIAASPVDQYEISNDGTIYAIYANGANSVIGRIPLVNVISPDRLTVLSGNGFSANSDSGAYNINWANSGSVGGIISGALESSNVDIAEELTNMIESQRSYTANSKVFQTGADLLDVLVNLKR